MQSASSGAKKIRSFIALYPAQEIVGELVEAQDAMLAGLEKAAIRRARPDQLHLTLQFLGHVEEERLALYERAIAGVMTAHRTFKLFAEQLGCFPSEKRPRILWAGLSGEVEPLQHLKAELDEVLASLGYEPELRPFHPHITLARIAELKRREVEVFQNNLSKHRAARFGEVSVGSIELMQSLLSPAGAKYVRLQTFPLKQN